MPIKWAPPWLKARLEEKACEFCHANTYAEGHSSGAVRIAAESDAIAAPALDADTISG